MAIQIRDAIELIIRKSLIGIDLWSPEAEQLLAGTAAQESQMLTFLKQIEGPGLGLYQMEPECHQDIHRNYLVYHPELRQKIFNSCGMVTFLQGASPPDELLIYNLKYATCMARLKYYRSNESLPAYNDIAGQSTYWKNIYNTVSGKGDTASYQANYERFVGAYYLKK